MKAITILPCVWIVVFSLAYSVHSISFDFGAWEHCYYEPATETIDVNNAFVRIVQSPRNLLGFQTHVNTTVKEELTNPIVNLQLWHQETGDRFKYGDHDACSFFVPSKYNKPILENDKTFCSINGEQSGMIERLFVEETPGNYKAQLQIFDSPSKTEELMCVEVSFQLDESFLSQYQKERKEKLNPKTETLLL